MHSLCRLPPFFSRLELQHRKLNFMPCTAHSAHCVGVIHLRLATMLLNLSDFHLYFSESLVAFQWRR